MAIWCRGDRMMAVLIVARKANVIVDRGAVSSRVAVGECGYTVTARRGGDGELVGFFEGRALRRPNGL
jgi:hypothetical protein